MTHASAGWLEGMERGDAPFTRAPMTGKSDWVTNDLRRQFYDRHGRDSFPAESRRHVRTSLHEALADAELAPDDPRIRFVTVPRMGPRLVDIMYLDVIETDLKAEHVLLGGRTGHLGSGDSIANMADVVEKRMLAPGEIAIIAGAGGGFGWSTAIVQVPA
jgi:3-oxoacyl-[acyl-carrier-protein] synthase-3